MEHTHAFQVCQTALDQLDDDCDDEAITAEDLVFGASLLSEEFKFFKQCDDTSKTISSELEIKYPNRNDESIFLFLEKRDNADAQRLRFNLIEKQRAYNAWHEYRKRIGPSMIPAAQEVLRLHNSLHNNGSQNNTNDSGTHHSSSEQN